MLRRRPIARMAVRTTAVVGTAAVVGGHMANKQAQQAAAQQPVEAAAAPPPSDAEDPYAELEKLGKLHQEGILTDEEFAAQKAKLLG